MGKRAAGVAIIAIIVIAFVYFYFYNQEQLVSTVDRIGATFSSGDQIWIDKVTPMLPDSIKSVLKTNQGNTITSQSLSPVFTNLAKLQKTNSTGNITKSEVTGGLSKGTISSNLQLQATQILAGVPTFHTHTGDVIFVTGQIVTKKLPQNINVAAVCCEMDAYIQSPAVATDDAGNFAYSIKSSESFPHGLWTVTITWTGNDGNLKSYDWQFNLVE